MEKKKDVFKWIWEDPWLLGQGDRGPWWEIPKYGAPQIGTSTGVFYGEDLFPYPSTFQKVNDGYQITVSSPGVKKEFMFVFLDDEKLTITYTADTIEYKKSFAVHNIKDVEAKYEDGVLTILARQQKKESKQITIK